MMDFIVMTLSFTVAILLATFLMCIFMCNKTVMKWYMKKAQKVTMDFLEITDEVFEETES